MKRWVLAFIFLIPFIAVGQQQRDFIRPEDSRDPEANYAYGSLVESSADQRTSAQVLRALVLDAKVNFALKDHLRQLGSARNFFGLFEPALSSQVILNYRVFSQDPVYRNILDAGPSLRFLMGEPTGTSEGYTVGQHSARLLTIYEDQKQAYFGNKNTQSYQVRNFDQFMKHLVLFHDIGKSVSYRAVGGNQQEIAFSTPFIEIFLRSLEYSQQEILIAQSLIDQHKVIGDYLTSRMSLDSAKRAIRAGARKANLNESRYFDLLEILFVCDAGSYPNLYRNVFVKDAAGKLNVKSAQYRPLQQEFLER